MLVGLNGIRVVTIKDYGRMQVVFFDVITINVRNFTKCNLFFSPNELFATERHHL